MRYSSRYAPLDGRLIVRDTHRMEYLKGIHNERINVNDDWVPIQAPDNLEEMLAAFVNDQEEKVGWCLLCNSAIRTENDMIPNTNTHDCEKGRAFDATIVEPQQPKPRCRPKRRVQN